ncbi:zinc finger protein Gfi-1-like isoform X1 [Hypomesus transpacificus]|uniref:zinc finger protein Gfi-1-like isoform X1 n=1 Tax=Hypomesus transpacificus TaxID=137520 RepID=UPI001F0879CB|nr:zinc finger protein Gfi-1-like isoform X1 [Hypomesus transpacificus]
MSGTGEFQAQIASIMEVLANAAVAEICKVVDDGYAVVHLEMSQSHKENEFLRRKIKLLELQIARFRTERMKFSEGSVSNRFGVRLLNRPLRDTQASGPSFQGRERSVSRTSAGRDRSPFHLNQDPASNCDVEAKNETTGPKQEEELDLLIVKVEGATGVDDPASSRDSERPPGGDRGLSPPSTTGQWDGAAGRNLTEVSGSQPPAVADYQSETKIESATPPHALTGSDLRGEMPYLDLSEAPVAQAWIEAAASYVPGTAGVDAETGPLGSDSASSTGQTGGSSASYGGVSAGGVAIGGVGGGRGVDRMMVWSEGVFSTGEGEVSGLSNDAGPKPHAAPAYQAPGTLSSNHTSSSGVSITNTRCSPDFSNAPSPHRTFQRPVGGHLGQGPAAGAALERPFACGLCRKRFVQESDLRKHRVNHARQKQFACPLCHKSFVCPSQLRVHQNVHTGERPFGCRQCGRSFSHPSNLKRHQKLQHD